MESIRKREEELMRRNAELEAKSGKAAKNATMILNSTTTMYKENSFLDNFLPPVARNYCFVYCNGEC